MRNKIDATADKDVMQLDEIESAHSSENPSAISMV